jgi:deferrochelatase/peroxidase EfeB
LAEVTSQPFTSRRRTGLAVRSSQDDDVPRGLYFIFLSAKAMATMEFLQQEWINNGNFMNLGDKRDPNVGLQEDAATFTIPQHPVRRRIHNNQTFNVLRGGEYFFMPSLSALRWIGDLPSPAGQAGK